MPPLPAAADVVRIQLVGTYGTDANVLNNIHAKFTGAPAEADLNNLGVAVRAGWTAHLAQYIAPAYTLTNVICTDLTSSTGAEGQDVANSAGTDSTGTALPAGVALVMRYTINRRYRGGHPRQYICGMTSTQLADEDHWSTTTITNWEAAYTLFAAAITGYSSGNISNLIIVNLSYVDGHGWYQDAKDNWHRTPLYRTTPLTDVVQGYIVNPIVGSMRRRLQQP